MGEVVLIAGLLMATALAASSLAGRLRVPALLLFLVIGMAIGTDGLGYVHFDDYRLARDIGIVALALILYEGGLTTDADDLRPVAGTAFSLAVLATLGTALITGLAAAWLFGLPLLEGLLLGSIVASTDAAAVFAMLRGSALTLRLTRILEGEAASNDPVAILLVIGFIEWIRRPDYGLGDMVVLFISQLAVGAAAGIVVGMLAAKGLRLLQLPTIGLYPVASLAAGAISFGVAGVLGGSGFLAIYLTGLALGSSSLLPAKRTITTFHVGLAWVAQLSMFLTLGLLVFPSQLGSIAVEGTLLALVLAFVARPVATLVPTLVGDFSVAERIVLAWAGLRGGVPVVLATFPVIAGVAGSLDFFNIVFFAVVFSLLLQGPTFEPLARRVGVTVAAPAMPEPIAEIGASRRLGAEAVEYAVAEGHATVGARVRELGLPREAVVSVIVRGDQAIPPRGSMRIRAGDHLHVLVRRSAAAEVAALMERWRNGPLGPEPRPRRELRSASPIFTVGPSGDSMVTGEITSPTAVSGQRVVARLRVRRDAPGALLALRDGRYAITGAQVVVGSREHITRYARRRVRHADEDEQAWLQTVTGALAADLFS